MSQTAVQAQATRAGQGSALVRRLIRNRYMYLMIIPGFLYFIVFRYIPMYGLIIAFQDYLPFKGITGSEWVGWKHFERFFTDSAFWSILRNTLLLFVYNLLFFFPIPIILAVMLNEVASTHLKRVMQSILYIPHFLSWVIVVSISFVMLTLDGGIINELLVYFGLPKINFLLSTDWFYPMYIAQIVWKEAGWGMIVYLAAIASIDPGLYEAARIDGAGRFRQIWHVTLPSIRSVIIVLLILRLGDVLEISFEHVYLLLNSMNRPVAEIIDTYVYTVGIKQGQFSFSTAVGFFKSFIGLILVVTANKLAKKAGEEGIY